MTATLTFAQDDSGKKNADQKKKNKLNFSEVEVEQNTEATSATPETTYRTLEIRYTKKERNEDKKVNINGQNFRCFEDKKNAISFYHMIKKKQDTPDYLIYYVRDETAKQPEVYTFRLE